MLARADNQYTDNIAAAMGMGEISIDQNGKVQQQEVSFVDEEGNTRKYMKNVNPREDAIENALVKFAKSEDKIEALASDNTGASLEAIREHVDQIRDGNKNAMPPSENWPNRDGGWQLRRKLEKNIESFVPDKPAGGRSSRTREWLMGQRGRQKKESGEAGGMSEGEVGDARQTQQQRPDLIDQPILDDQGNPVLDEAGDPVTQKVVDPEGGQYKGAVDARADREYLKPGKQPPEGVKEYSAERRGKDGKRARYYSRKEAAAVRNQQQNGGSGGDDDDTPPPGGSGDTPPPGGSGGDTPPPSGGPTPKPKASPERLRGRREGGRRKATQVREEPDEQEIGKAGENEMAPTNAPKTPQDAQADQYQKAMENEVAGAKRVSQKSKARSANANARVAVARADEAEVKARRAEDDREVHISELLHKLDSNISELTVTSNPEVAGVYQHLEKTIGELEKGIFRSKPDIRVGTRPEPSIIEPPPSDKPREGLDYTRGASLPKKKKGSEIDKQNPFASLAGHMGAAFREAGKPKKKPTIPRRQPKPSLPEYDPQPTPDKPASTTSSTNGAGSAGGA